MGANVIDFTDLGRGTEFTYQGGKFEVPSFTKSEMEHLMEISEKMVDISRNLSSDEKDALKKGDIKTSELKKLFNVQQEFIVAGVVKITEAGKVPFTMEECEKWPWKLCTKIISLIQNMMSVMGDEDKGSKKNPT